MPVIHLPASVSDILSRLAAAGYTAHAVGGCVRDSLLGRPVHDWDITTSATPDEIKAVFAHNRIIDTGIRHGTVTVMWDGQPFEITTYRVDGTYTDGRHPDEVTFTGNLSEDLARRDFTVNAMAYAPSDGLIDLYGGREDLHRGLIRAVGDPLRRFTEDALRILRAARFAAVLGFFVEEQTLSAALELRGRLAMVSGERICGEMNKMLTADFAAPVLRAASPLLSAAWPCLSAEAFCASADVVSALPARLPLRLAAVFAQSLPSAPAATLLSLRQSRRTAEEAAAILSVAQTLSVGGQGREEKLSLLGKYGLSVCTDACLLAQAAGLLPDEAAQQYAHDFARWQAEGTCCKKSDLALTGADLLGLGIPSGEAVGRLLDELLRLVMAGRLQNTRTALADHVCKRTEAPR